MKLGPYTVSLHNHGYFRLDGGAMFGVVPKTIWAREAPPDDQNRILMATRSLVIEGNGRKALVDVGCGDKWTDKLRSIYDIANTPYSPVEAVTDVVLTHLHFDHAGGLSRLEEAEIVPCYPDAAHHVARANYENAKAPNSRERASYLPENVGALDQVETTLTEDGQEILPGLTVHQVHGHTRGLQWIKLSVGGETLVYPSDLFPTSRHLPRACVMGYDMCAETSMRERAAFIEEAVAGNWIVVFEHDPEVSAGRIALDDRGRPFMGERVEL